MILIAVVMAVTFLLNVVKVAQPVAGAQAAGYGFFAMLRYALIENPIESLKNVTNDIATFYKLKQENDYYRSQLEMLALYKAELEEAYRQIAQLKEVAGIKTAANEYTLSSAKVIYRSFDTFNHALVINQGSAEGIKINQAVITTKGLIGKVVEVFDHSAIVRLLTQLGMHTGCNHQRSSTPVACKSAHVTHILSVAERKFSMLKWFRELLDRFRFACEGCFLDAQVDAFDDPAIGRDDTTCLKLHKVAGYEVPRVHFLNLPIAHYPHRWRGHLFQGCDGFLCAMLLNHAQYHEQHYYRENRDGIDGQPVTSLEY
mgnify:CR=1 FL=1